MYHTSADVLPSSSSTLRSWMPGLEWYCSRLYLTILYCAAAVLCTLHSALCKPSSELHSTPLHCTALHYTEACCTALYSDSIMLYYTVGRWTVLYIPHCTALRHTMLQHTLLQHTRPHSTAHTQDCTPLWVYCHA